MLLTFNYLTLHDMNEQMSQVTEFADTHVSHLNECNYQVVPFIVSNGEWLSFCR